MEGKREITKRLWSGYIPLRITSSLPADAVELFGLANPTRTLSELFLRKYIVQHKRLYIEQQNKYSKLGLYSAFMVAVDK